MASHQCSIFSAYLILLICPVKNGGITITDTTERLLNQYVADAQASPERSEALVAAFNGAFWLWYQLTRDSDNPDRDADGTRFMDLIPEFPEQ